jgi:hypothetical protein
MIKKVDGLQLLGRLIDDVGWLLFVLALFLLLVLGDSRFGKRLSLSIKDSQ